MFWAVLAALVEMVPGTGGLAPHESGSVPDWCDRGRSLWVERGLEVADVKEADDLVGGDGKSGVE